MRRWTVLMGLFCVAACATDQSGSKAIPPGELPPVHVPQPIAPAPKPVERIAVLEFALGPGIDIDRIYFSDKVRGAIGDRAPKLFVMTRESTDVLLQATERKITDCDSECEVETGRRLGADYIVSGRVSRVGSRLALTMRLHSTKEARLLRASEALAPNADGLVDASLGAVDDLLRGIGIVPVRATPPPPVTPSAGTLKVFSLPKGAEVLIDASPVGKTPFVKALPAGSYWVSIEKSGFEPIHKTVELAAGATVTIGEPLSRQTVEPTAKVTNQEPVSRYPEQCPEPVNGSRWYIRTDPHQAPAGLDWFRVAPEAVLTIEATFTQTVNETDLSLYQGETRIYELNSLSAHRGSFHANGGACFAIGVYHKNGNNDGGLPWVITDAKWVGQSPSGSGTWVYQFGYPGSTGSVTVSVR